MKITSLYIHIPWCVRKCPYCDFNSHQKDRDLPEEQYLRALARDMQFEAKKNAARIETVFIGGGTPSLFSAKAIGQILRDVDQFFGLAAGAEITLEANPGTVEYEKFAGFRSAGVNRLSIGVQSFQDELLKDIGRIHDAAQAVKAVQFARKCGYDSYNIDLMYGLPGQSIEQALSDVRQAINLNAPHISHYQLTLEPNTWFYKYPPKLPEDDVIADMLDACQSALKLSGYDQYEVSAYAKMNMQCRHNINYWLFGDYIGVGAGAHGKQTGKDGSIMRTLKHRHPDTYMNCENGEQMLLSSNVLSEKELIAEFAINALRLRAGFGLSDFEKKTGLAAEKLKYPVEQGVMQNLLETDEGIVRPTEHGWAFLNDTMELFL